MPCCAQSIIPFSNQIVTNVPYGAGMRGVYGDVPTVTVLYWNGQDYVVAGISTQVLLQRATPHPGAPLENIRIDHGGLSSGIVKIG